MTTTPTRPTEPTPLPREELYRQWLGIPMPFPSYYRLLGVPELETDPSAIFHAARHVKRKIRAYQIGAYRPQALDLLAEVAQAVAVLTNPEKKRAYDNHLAKQWKATVEELYRAHGEGAPRDSGVLEAWLTACAARGVPVTRILPAIVRSLGRRIDEWPPGGEHRLAMPINLWIYRDAVILGQCLHLGSLEKRADIVKQVQKLLGMTEGLARLVAEEVSRNLHLFAAMRLVTAAKKDPEGLLVRLGRRIRRFGGHLSRRGKVPAAVAQLLGKHKQDLVRAFDRMTEPVVDLSPRQKITVGMRRWERRAKRVKDFSSHWVAQRPQILVGVGLLIGLAVLIVSVLVATGAWVPWKLPSAPAAPMPPAAPSLSAEPPPTGSPKQETTPPVSPPETDRWTKTLESLKELRGKYPVEPAPHPPAEEKAAQPKKPQNKPDPETSVPSSDSPRTKFFGVPAKPAKPSPE